MNEKKFKIKLIIIIVELVILVGLSSYRVYEYVIKDKEEIKENESGNENAKKYRVTFDYGNNSIRSIEVKENEKIEFPDIPIKEGYIFGGWLNNYTLIDENYIVKEDVTLKINWIDEKLTSGIKILVYQINLRKEANESSEDIGDLLLDETYEVLEIIDSANYTWYKIKQGNIVGYVASKKGENWVEYSDNGQFESAKVYDATDDMALMYEDNKYFIYDYKTKEKRYLNIEKNYNFDELKFVNYEGKIYGIFSKKCFRAAYNNCIYYNSMYYSLVSDKTLYDENVFLQEKDFDTNEEYFLQSAIVNIELDNLPFLKINKSWERAALGSTGRMYPLSAYYKKHQIEVIDIRSEKIISTTDTLPYLQDIKVGDKKYYIALHIGRIYDSNYKLIEHISFLPNKIIGSYVSFCSAGAVCGDPWYLNESYNGSYQINSNETLVLNNENKYIVYDKNMNEIYTSKEHEKIHFVDSYVITQNENKLAINDLNGNVIKEFELANEETTGFSNEEGTIKIATRTKNDNNEYEYKYYYYIHKTGESGIKKI